MGDNLNSILLPFLDSETKFHDLNYYLCKALHKTVEDKLGEDHEQDLVYKLECLYEWWESEQHEMIQPNHQLA